MGRKIDRKQPAAEQPSAAEDLQALQPNATITLAGRSVTLREYGLWEGLKAAAIAKDLIADMYEIAVSGELTYTTARYLFGKHQAAVVAISAMSADVEPEWIEGLGAVDGEQFLSTWMVVNGSFFGRELAVAGQVARIAKAMGSRSTGSSSDSPVPDSATSTDLGNSPSAS